MMEKTKLWQGVKILLLATVILTTVNGCKKDAERIKLSDKQQIQKAKEWYEAEQRGKVTKLAIAEGKETELLFAPDWNNAKVDDVDGIISISTEIKTNLESKFKMDRYYTLVIKNDDSKFESRVLYIDSRNQTKDENVLTPTQLYEAAFTNADLSNEGNIKAEIKVYGNRFKNLSNVLYTDNGKEVLPVIKLKMGKNLSTEGCYDAYMVTRVYENGVLVDTYQEYLGFEICPPMNQYFQPTPGGSGGGGEYGSTDINIEWGAPQSTHVSTYTVTTTGTDSAYIGTVNYDRITAKWGIYTAEEGAINFYSTETIHVMRGIHRSQGSVKVVLNTVHNFTEVTGSVPNQDVSCTFGNFLDTTNPDEAKVRIYFGDTRIPYLNGVPQTQRTTYFDAQTAWPKSLL